MERIKKEADIIIGNDQGTQTDPTGLNQEYTKTSTYGLHNEVGIITLCHAKTFNSFSDPMRDSIAAAIHLHEKDPSVKVICLRSSDKKVFCPGADLKGLVNVTRRSQVSFDMFRNLDLALYHCSKPIICAVNKLALGGGFELALHCDIILASSNAKFGLPEITLGLLPGLGGTSIAKYIGKHNAMKLILTGERIKAERALQLGIVQAVYPEEELHREQLKLASKIAEFSGSVLALAKQATKFSSDNSSVSREFERNLFQSSLGLRGSKEGLNAFLNKRKPDYTGI